MTDTAKNNLHGATIVTLTDGREVTVKMITARQLDQYLQLLPDDFARLCLVIDGISSEELEALPVEDFEKLIEADEALNGPFAERHQERLNKRQVAQFKTMRQLFPDKFEEAEAKVFQLIEQAIAGSLESPDMSASPATAGTKP